jgi:ABC-2 type transport system permease protein
VRSAANIFWLGTKELRSFLHDVVLLAFVVWSFSLAILTQSQGHLEDIYHASVALLDEDGSVLSHQIAGAFLPPEFAAPVPVADSDIDRLMNIGQFTFFVHIPPHFERDLLARRQPSVQLVVDATAMAQAGIGSGYAQQIISDEITRYLTRAGIATTTAQVPLDLRLAFNPNSDPSWFISVMGIINNINILAIILAGAAVVREREHGTLDHLLVMPLTPFEIAMSKVWANGLVIAIAVVLSLYFIVQGLVGVPIAGSIPLFVFGVVIYLFFATAIGIFLGTLARSMPQLGLLLILVALPMNMLSGANTPIESMPTWLRTVMEASPSTHFVSIAQAILYRGAGLAIVWPHFLVVAGVGAVFLGIAVLRFRKVTAQPA